MRQCLRYHERHSDTTGGRGEGATIALEEAKEASDHAADDAASGAASPGDGSTDRAEPRGCCQNSTEVVTQV